MRLTLGPLILLAAWSVACATSDPQDTASACPPPTDPCMNEDNYQECLEVEATCDGGLLIMESCPLQFGCAD